MELSRWGQRERTRSRVFISTKFHFLHILVILWNIHRYNKDAAEQVLLIEHGESVLVCEEYSIEGLDATTHTLSFRRDITVCHSISFPLGTRKYHDTQLPVLKTITKGLYFFIFAELLVHETVTGRFTYELV